MDEPEEEIEIEIEDMNPEEIIKTLIEEIKGLKTDFAEVFKEGIKQTKEEVDKYLKELSDEILAKKDKQLKALDKHINNLQELREQVEKDKIVLVGITVSVQTAKV